MSGQRSTSNGGRVARNVLRKDSHTRALSTNLVARCIHGTKRVGADSDDQRRFDRRESPQPLSVRERRASPPDPLSLRERGNQGGVMNALLRRRLEMAERV